jgi:hypothetical protein
MRKRKYQAWTNYPTYGINHLIWDDWRLCRVASDGAREGYGADKIAANLKERVETLYPYQALDGVNWLEIADNFCDVRKLCI